MPFIQGKEIFGVHVIGVDVIIVRFYDIIPLYDALKLVCKSRHIGY